MNIVFTVLSLAVILVAVATRSGTTNEVSPATVLSEATAEPTQAPIESPEPTVESTSTPSAEPTTTVNNTSTTPTPSKQPKPVAPLLISGWVYSPSSVVSQNNTQIVLSSNDAPKTITAWYKDKMASMGYTSTSVIQTQSNEKTLNKLAGSSNENSVSIEIKRDTESAPVTITVNFTASNSSI